MNIREFSFKFFNNSLGLNQRLARYVGGRGEECTFCSIANKGPNVPETFIHFFFDVKLLTQVSWRWRNTCLNHLSDEINNGYVPTFVQCVPRGTSAKRRTLFQNFSVM